MKKIKKDEKKTCKTITEFLGIPDRRSKVVFTLLMFLGIMYIAPLPINIFGIGEDFSVDFIATDVSAESPGYTKDFVEVHGVTMILTRYSDIIRIAVLSNSGNVQCVIDTEAGIETKQLRRMENGKFFGEIEAGSLDIPVTCNGITVVSHYVDDLKPSKNFISGFAGIPMMIPY